MRSTDVHKCARQLVLVGRSTGSFDRPESFALWKWPQSTGSVDRTESLLSVSNSGRPGGRPAREPLLSGSGHGRPGGRPLGSTVTFLTVSRSTGRSILTLSAANGQNFYGGYIYPI